VAFRELRQDKDFFDVTLSCDDEQQLQAHKVILSACSPFFRNILRRNPHQHPLLYLKGVKYTDLQSVLNFMYHGEVNVAQDELNSFLAVAEDLRVKGLTQNQPARHDSSSSGGGAVNSNTGKAAARPRSPLSGSQKASRPPDPTGGQPPPKRPRPSVPPTASYSSSRTDGGGGSGDDADDDIQEVVPVKSEPREAAAVTAAVAGPVSAATAADNSYSNALVSEEGEAYDESYEDYGQYEQSFGGGEGGSESALVDLGPDGSKGKDSSLLHHISHNKICQFVFKDVFKQIFSKP
jgi:BTB/POZ domain